MTKKYSLMIKIIMTMLMHFLSCGLYVNYTGWLLGHQMTVWQLLVQLGVSLQTWDRDTNSSASIGTRPSHLREAIVGPSKWVNSLEGKTAQRSIASPGQTSNVVSLSSSWFNKSEKLKFWNGTNEASSGVLRSRSTEEQNDHKKTLKTTQEICKHHRNNKNITSMYPKINRTIM